MYGQADLPPSIHLKNHNNEKKFITMKINTNKKGTKWELNKIWNLLGLAIELRELELGSCGGIGDRDIELEVELVLEEIVHVPALACPTCPLRIGRGDPEPIVVVGLVHLCVGDEGLVLLLQPLRPGRTVSWPGFRR